MHWLERNVKPVTALTIEDIDTITDDLTRPTRGWAAVRHQLYLRRKLAQVIAAFNENERMRRDAVELIRAENRRLHRRALEAEGFIAYSGLERTYGLRDTSTRPRTPDHEDGLL